MFSNYNWIINSIANKAGILFSSGHLVPPAGKSSRGLLEPHYNFRVALDQILNGAKLQGGILGALLSSSEIIVQGFKALPESRDLIEKIWKVIKKVNTGDSNDMKAYSALIAKALPGMPEQVSAF